MSLPAACVHSEVIACIGCNAPESEKRIREAVEYLRQLAEPESLIATPVYHCGDSAYGNALVRFSTALELSDLTERTKAYERSCGRTPESKLRGIIEMDIDLVVANGRILRHADYATPYFSEGLRRLMMVPGRSS